MRAHVASRRVRGAVVNVRARSRRPASICPAKMASLADAHCHVQEDPQHQDDVQRLSASRIAVMGTAVTDWPAVQQLRAMVPNKVIPCFGVHPWYAHKHGMRESTCVRNVVEAKSEDELRKLGELLNNELPISWQPKLRQLLLEYPESIVGEFGLDRAAVIPGSKANVTWQHQWELFTHHMDLAAELGRPVSLHCVRAYGHLADYFRALPPARCPPKVMLHSFGGSPDMVTTFTKLPNGLGQRFYFGFSHVINSKANAVSEKLLARIRAVPERRLLAESDHVTVSEVDPGLASIVGVIAEAKGWDEGRAAEVTYANFCDFYGASLAVMEGQEGGGAVEGVQR